MLYRFMLFTQPLSSADEKMYLLEVDNALLYTSFVQVFQNIKVVAIAICTYACIYVKPT